MPESSLIAGSALEAGVQIGDFRIERRLGAGGMGIVYRATQISLNRPVALKVLGQALTQPGDLSRFQREAQAAARLRHPSIAQVYFIGQDRHICYMAMELVEGISLRRVLEHLGRTPTSETGIDTVVHEDLQGEPQAAAVRFDLPTEHFGPNAIEKEKPEKAPPPASTNPYLSPQARELRTSAAHVKRACEIARDAARALVHAHEQGVVHRDIKPDNLLLDRRGQTHLIDFGVARFFDDQAVTYTGQLVGTPLYMSPEQVTGRGVVDARTDVYSLGLVLYELLTLRPAVEAVNRENLLRQIVTKPLVPVSWRNSAVPSDLEAVVHRATQKDPDERYRSASEFADDLERHLAGKPVVAPAYRFRLDEREITAARPGGVVLAAFILFMVSFAAFMFLASVSLMIGMVMATAEGAWMSAVQGLLGLAILAAGVSVGWFLLAGRSWARWTAVVLAGLLLIASTAAVAGLVSFAIWSLNSAEMQTALQPQPPPPGGAPPPFQPQRFVLGMVGMYALPGVFGVLMGITALWSLLSRETGNWFRFARSIREEHQALRSEIG